MQFRVLIVLLISTIVWLASWFITAPASALTPIKLSDLFYEECPAELAPGIVNSGDLRPANCFLVKGKAENKSGKTVVDADVFGRIYDANGNSVMENRGRVGTIVEVPPGVSDFEIRISVPANQPTPLKLEQFKASGFADRVRPFYYDN
ncbi:hypothetical protein IQ238_10460 [Pleurocapsales cyanobacterium LEGE 06147]|nr:hypothetical protein [Pleurocapsales cyanobacterium LEGE 06147]